MNAENHQALQGEIENPLVAPNDDVQQVIVDGLYILTNEKARTLLNLSGGFIDSGTVCHGWQCNPCHGMDHQLWELKQSGANGSYRIMSFRGLTYLDLEAGKSEDGTKVFACSYVGEGSNRLRQEWFIEEHEGSYKFGDIFSILKPDNGIQATCSRWVGGDHQLWDLERVSGRTAEIKAIIESWKPNLLSRVIQPHADNNDQLRNVIWNDTKLMRQSVRKSSYDYDSFVIRTKDAVNAWARDTMRIEARRGPKAYNWYLSPDMQSLMFFDAQTGKEYTAAGIVRFGVLPNPPSPPVRQQPQAIDSIAIAVPMVFATANIQSNTTTESDTNTLPAYSSEEKPQGIPGGLYVLINKKTRTLLDLSGGKLECATVSFHIRLIDPPSA
ncbi:hypothetical protein FRC00_001563 [Tulasnella sp. 408]|nr:hypothetical protein FRC00_001563 [Tulasnella sp. 408]